MVFLSVDGMFSITEDNICSYEGHDTLLGNVGLCLWGDTNC